jgi:RNA polymerase sigma-B factor
LTLSPGVLESPSVASSAELFGRWRRDHDRRARDELIERYLPLARKLARRYAQSSEPFDDLVQVASLALVKAVERFDPDRGFAFTSFAVPTIVGELKRYFRDTGWALHVDRGAQERARRITDAQTRIAARTGHVPTIGDIAQYLEISQEDVLDGLQTAEAYGAVSLDASLSNDDGETFSRMETLGDDDQRLVRVDDQATIFAAAKSLSEREKTVIYLRFSEDLTQSQIAARIGVSQMQVSRVLRRALHRLRELTDERQLGVPPDYRHSEGPRRPSPSRAGRCSPPPARPPG